MWTLLFLFLAFGLLIMVGSMIVTGVWFWKKSRIDNSANQTMTYEALMQLAEQTEAEEDELTSWLDQQGWYVYTHDKEGNVITKNP